ncbi:helix-turn-helix domain-containing protein [Tuanshanicoccus yangjingiae]|nr:helix-turn-helix domain-containing protein [Facklamia sp. 252]NEW67096.1 helix-turn-helix domain-containing protein [Facklamia sp. 253]QQD66501.1 helix-turn-helix domain-containing protein [Aerococcaceae bacterium zg-252]
MNTITNYLLQNTQHEIEQRRLNRFIPDIPGISDVPTGHVPILQDALFFQNKDVFISKHSRYAAYPEHSHQFLEFNYMVQGECQQIINGEPITLSAGDLLLMDTGSTHSIQPLGEQDILCNLLFHNNHLSLEWLGDLKSKNSLLYQALLHQSSSKRQRFALIRANEDNQIQRIMEQLLTEYFLPSDFSESIISHYIPILLYEIARHLPELTSDQFEQATHEPFYKALDLIDRQYAQLTLNDAARILNFNKNYLSNLIKDKSGKTFTELLNEKKLKKAQLLIQSTKLPINEIAQQVGYSNRTYFYKNYNDYFGHSPAFDRTQDTS